MYEELTNKILKCAYKVHTALGPGLFESVYQKCLCYELIKMGIHFEEEKSVPLVYESLIIDTAFRIDILVEGKVIVELKAVERLTSVHHSQILSYLKTSNKKVGVLINFNTVSLKNGIKRYAM